MFEVDVKNVMEGREGEGREGGDQARFFMWIHTYILYCTVQYTPVLQA